MRIVLASILLILFGGSAAMAEPVTAAQAVTLINASTVAYGSRADWEAAVTGPLATIAFEVDNWDTHLTLPEGLRISLVVARRSVM